MNGIKNLLLLVLAISLYNCGGTDKPQPKKESTRPNILFIPVDDLRPELGSYGNDFVKTPNIDRIAQQGVVFMRAYCQQAVCNPSRASLLTGLRPDSIRVWDLSTKLRNNVPDVVTLPQYFKQNGYITVGLGKTFHNDIQDSVSWTERPHLEGFPFDPDAVYASKRNTDIQEEKKQKLIAQGKIRLDPLGHWYLKANSTENADVPDDAYYDGAQTTYAVDKLEVLAAQEKPFFLSVGYYKPHLPFNAPKKYWDMYHRDSIPLAENQSLPKGSPDFAVHGDQELRYYDDNHDLPRPNEAPWNEDRQREVKHGYYASVSYIDAQIGRLYDKLEKLNLLDNTIIVLWGDHGWKLGEHNGWGKMSNYEIDAHVPMIISGAKVKAKGSKTNALTELVDIYPSLCEMSGLPVPAHLQGKSFVPLLADPSIKWKAAAYSQFLLGRFGPAETRQEERMGYSVKTDRYRYTEWYTWNKNQKQKGDYISSELFDHENDPGENYNIAQEPSNSQLIKQLASNLHKNF
ncbi:sulfatase [Zobellia galactanivorans]|uniref:Iduronate-2-sulfatase, family S1-7 n=1 Tax=Zobellia galactanivorans (strain DSM 12802 / CCUG 47099 / CIP 106680 / NCIMB 13871 / Dsij) TaxID=63186 RepID=G0L8L6_ZOBGA|nr:sulfatase [Zobellia galactanivorans]CAZ97664.1 Iduronate-2-sulfatase, family S1-7 [Zobellia galactanivorans]